MFRVLKNYKFRSMQRSFLQIVLFFSASPEKALNRSSVQLAVGTVLRSSAFQRLSYSPNTSMDSPETSQIFTIKTQLNSLVFVIHEALQRNLFTSFKLIEVLAEQKIADIHIQDLREDNEKLRIHNEALSDNLNRSANDFELILT
jgi:hypothetical protein